MNLKSTRKFMPQREDTISTFLQRQNLENAERYAISGDASFRRYFRIKKGARNYILMDAPPPKEHVAPFVHIAGYLKRLGLSAPRIYQIDEVQGLLLLEDLGDDTFSAILTNDPTREHELYQAAMDVLIHLSNAKLPRKLPAYSTPRLLDESLLLIDWFMPYVIGCTPNSSAREHYHYLWNQLFHIASIGHSTIVLRDYHADNLMWLPNRKAIKRVGLLDFQDAVVGSPIYDIVSLLEDARRDVSNSTRQAMINHYLTARPDITRTDFDASYAILSAQRNCKIIGIFARLAVRDQKPRYLQYLPRVWNNLENNLSHPALSDVKTWIDEHIPKNTRYNINLSSSVSAYGAA